MSDDQTLYGAIAVVSACIVFIIRAVLAAKKGAEVVATFDKYKSYALLAAKWTEATIPDTYGTEADAGNVKKSLAKLDVYLKKFTELVKDNENTIPNADLIDMAKAWSVELAKQAAAGKAAA